MVLSIPRSRLLPAILIAAMLLVVGGCSSRGLSARDKDRLDGLDARGAVHAYFEAGDQDTELYLSPPEEREHRRQPNYVADDERVDGVRGLVIEGGTPANPPLRRFSEYQNQKLFTVTYTSRRTNSIGDPPGKRMYFVYTGRDSEGSWKVLSVGTAP